MENYFTTLNTWSETCNVLLLGNSVKFHIPLQLMHNNKNRLQNQGKKRLYKQMSHPQNCETVQKIQKWLTEFCLSISNTAVFPNFHFQSFCSLNSFWKPQRISEILSTFFLALRVQTHCWRCFLFVIHSHPPPHHHPHHYRTFSLWLLSLQQATASSWSFLPTTNRAAETIHVA